MEDKLARDQSTTKNPHFGNTSLTLGSVLFCEPTLAPVPIVTPAPAPIFSNKLFKQFMKTYLKSNQRPSQPLVKRKRLFKTNVPDICYSKLYMDYYYFCQQCKDYFETA